MYQIRFTKTIKGKDIINRFKDKYGSLDNLKKLHKDGKNPENSCTCFELEEWDVYKNTLEEDVKETRVLITEEPAIGKIELEIFDIIKSHNPESIEDLARLMDKDIKIVNEKLNYLAENKFIELKEVSKNNKIPIFPYDYMQIVIGEVPISNNPNLYYDRGEVYENAN